MVTVMIKSMLTVKRVGNFCKRRFKLRFLLYVIALAVVALKVGLWHG